MFELKITGLGQMQAQLEALGVAITAAAGDALRVEAELEMTEAKRRTPVDTGALRASGHVVGPDHEAGGDQVVTLGFGGPAGAGNLDSETNGEDVGYAVYVHENMESLHETGQSKYLESVLLESAPHLADRVAARLAETIGS